MNGLKRIFSFINHHGLAGRNKVRAYINLFWWQIISRIKTGPVEVDFIHPVRFLAKKGMTGITGNIYTGLHEFEEMAFLLHFLRSGDLFIDVGANVGSYTLLASGVCGSESIAFEPAPETFKTLSQNIALNKLEHLTILENKGVGAEESSLWVTTDSDTMNHVELSPANGRSMQINICSLDQYLENRVPILIKIDVEGYETDVIKGARHLLKSEDLKAIIIELNGSGSRYGYNEQHIHAELLANGFSPYLYRPFGRDLLNSDSYGTHNTLYIRDIDFVKNRLRTATAFKALNRSV